MGSISRRLNEVSDPVSIQIEAFSSSFGKERESFLEPFFVVLTSAIMEALGAVSSTSASGMAPVFDQLSVRCQQLQKYLSDSILFLPSFDVRQSQEVAATTFHRT